MMQMSIATMYTTRFCPYCVAARRMLSALGVDYEEIDVGAEPQRRAEMMELSGRHTVPQIWIGEHHIGGFDDMNALHREGKLTPLLEEARERVQSRD